MQDKVSGVRRQVPGVRDQGAGTMDQGVIPNYLFISCLLMVAVLINSCTGPKEKIFRKSSLLMDTLVSISVVAETEDRALKAMDIAFKEIEKLDNMLNYFSEKSEVSQINRSAGIRPVRVSTETLDIIEKALYVSEKTSGAFDITIGPLISLWDFGSSPSKPPGNKLIRERMSLVNYRDVDLNRKGSTVYLKKKGMSIDLGGIAKGYAADRAVSELKREGIRAGLVAIAGDIKGFGLKPDGKAWSVGIRNPRQKGKEDEIMAVIGLKDKAISTAGDYERYFIVDGRRYHHLLDPHTGYPSYECRSVSVIAGDGVLTDSFSTGIFILGIKKGMRVLEEMGLDAVIVDNDGRMHTTKGLSEKLEFKRDN